MYLKLQLIKMIKKRSVVSYIHIIYQDFSYYIIFLAFWTTRLMAENYGREMVLKTTLCETGIYLFFIIVVLVGKQNLGVY